MLRERPCRKPSGPSLPGRNRPPIDHESEVSGARLGLPPSSVAHCPAGHWRIWLVVPPLPYWVAVTPVRWHCASVAVAGTRTPAALNVGAHGSSDTTLVLVTVAGEYASRMLAARMARSYDPRSV